MTKTLKYIVGGFLVVLGMTLVLCWWADVLAFFRGFLGMALAVGGLLVLYSLNSK